MYEQTNKYKYSNKDLKYQCTIATAQKSNQKKKCVQKQLKSVLGGLLVLAGLRWSNLIFFSSFGQFYWFGQSEKTARPT